MSSSFGFPVTDAGNRTIEVYLYDLENDSFTEMPIRVKRSQYSKWYYEGRIKRAFRSIPIVEFQSNEIH